jgi:hypothetical protein
MLKSVETVFGHLPLLPDALPKRVCSDFEDKLILWGWLRLSPVRKFSGS